jgi:hypothetical protein
MGNLPPLLDLICRFRTGRGLVTGEALVLAALGAIELVIWYSMQRVLPAEGGADGRRAQSVGGASEIAA